MLPSEITQELWSQPTEGTASHTWDLRPVPPLPSQSHWEPTALQNRTPSWAGQEGMGGGTAGTPRPRGQALRDTPLQGAGLNITSLNQLCKEKHTQTEAPG